ncbi:SelL-related redox protein [uncultured Gimesia sp.]|uniref:SelL-related redox protein n=1 Tax=uncultured Gimesia sp. TaxID=1678688 RepID=UPI0030D9F467|tara:strand:- start:46076 stop:46612 length:537 start_codon:yes stop_codon:yes gene_type:complete
MDQNQFKAALAAFPSSQGKTLDKLSEERPVLVVFLRHGGCPFCRQVLAQLQALSAKIEQRNLQLAIVHMMDLEQADKLLSRYALENVQHFSDPERKLYEVFQVRRGKLSETIGPAIWWSGFKTTILSGYLPGIPGKDIQQLGAAIILDKGNVVASHFSQNSSDLPDWDQLLACEIPHD